jgi:hypothetical protein
MKLAEKVKLMIEADSPSCFSLYAGYGMAGGKYVRFPVGAQLAERRNENGRVTRALYKYADDSCLEYKYNPRNESYTLTAI